MFIAGVIIGVTGNEAQFSYITHDELVHCWALKRASMLALVHFEHTPWSFDSISREALFP